ncbi:MULTISPECIES: DUF2800 domain-containing protein [unclassified Gemella]|uniref:DUF2800 domain-containing protein n=1 Tax=unclassified Gemella TaxID=2624949 RepID=UPI001C03BAAB|nr:MULTISPECIES: DUF2800 domain-containing protein [unclassified Gemella]MBU0278734.1 DUF2800 domain-containing protein [Gemella sp. zg-1178]QWQ38675.1 DUF2800 domain-containing protein [Gemella sp. zg-570]
MTEKHAVLSPSSAHRWITCPGLPQLEKFFANKTSEVAHEGTLAHAVAENKLRKALGMKYKMIQVSDIDMDAYTDDYVAYILQELENIKQSTKDPVVLVEERLDFSNYVPEGFGTGDCLIIADEKLYIIDFKYGKSVQVDAKDNPQMMLYALGALNLYDALYDIKEVTMTIFQPRKFHISRDTKSVDDLLHWANTELKEKAELAFKGEGTIEYGPWLQFSNCNAVLRVRKDYHDKLKQFQLASPHLLTDAEIEEVLEHVDDLVKWATEIKEYATKVAIETDKEWSGYKLVEGRSIRKFKDEEQVAKIAQENGYTNIYRQSLITLTDMQKLMGRDKFNELLGNYIYKPQGKPTLVPITDKRKTFIMHNAKQEFKEEK